MTKKKFKRNGYGELVGDPIEIKKYLNRQLCKKYIKVLKRLIKDLKRYDRLRNKNTNP